MNDYCEHCGTRLEPGAKFCSECGEPVDVVDDGWGTITVEEQEPVAEPGQDTTLAVLAHVLAMFTWVIGPLVILAVAEDEFTDANAKTAINWQIMFTIYMLISMILILVGIGLLLVMIMPLVNMVVCVIAAVKANEGETWNYPLTPKIL